MGFYINNTAKPIGLPDKEGELVLFPSEITEITDARLKELKKNKVIKSYFKKKFIIAVDEDEDEDDEVKAVKGK